MIRIDGTSIIEITPNTGTYKIIKCEPYLDDNVWKLNVSFYANSSVINMIYTYQLYLGSTSTNIMPIDIIP